jgi:hypothetical protein
MKALVATRQTQGRRKNDFCHATEGEFVTFGSECDGEKVDGGCGCKRALVGFDSSKATTTFRVSVSDITEDGLRDLLRAKLTKEGWISEAFTAEQNDEMLNTNVTYTISLWSSFEKCSKGTIVERRGHRFNERRV